MTESQRAIWMNLIREFHRDMGHPAIARMDDTRILDRTSGQVAAMFWLEVKRDSA